MARAKRMSDMFASSGGGKVAASPTTAATPPYSSDGPTLPILKGDATSNVKVDNTSVQNCSPREASSTDTNKKRKTAAQASDDKSAKQARRGPTNHQALYEPWTLLPRETFKPLEAQARLRGMQNMVPVVFTKNQDIKAGINRLKAYLGAHRNISSAPELPAALKHDDAIIAVSAQGDGTAKLVSIVDMTKRIMGPSTKEDEKGGNFDTWWMYTVLSSLEIEKKKTDTGARNVEDGELLEDAQNSEEDDAFEPLEVGKASKAMSLEMHRARKMPILTVWMTRKRIPAFKEAFGEQTLLVRPILQDDE